MIREYTPGRGTDALGEETDEMLRDRVLRSSMHEWPGGYLGQRLPPEPRQGPVQLSQGELRAYTLACAIDELLLEANAFLTCESEHGSEPIYVAVDGYTHYIERQE